LVNNDPESVVSGTLSCSTSAVPGSPAGNTYTISNCSGLSASNYDITYATGHLAVTPAPLQVAVAGTQTYGGAPSFSRTGLTGLVNSESTSVVTGTLACTTTATAVSAAGTYPITGCSGLSATNYSLSYQLGTVTVGKRAVVLGYTGPLFVSTGSATATSTSVTVQGVVTPTSPGDITKSAPTFLFFKGTNTGTTPDYSCVATVTSAGVATCTRSLSVDNWTVVMCEPLANQYYSGPRSDPVVLTVYQPLEGASANGGGWVIDPSTKDVPVAISSANRHGNFGFTVRYKKGSTTIPQGQVVYVFRGSNGYDYILKSNAWTGGGFSVSGSRGSFSGRANVTVVDPATGLAVPALGGGNFTFRVDVNDGTPDTYALSIYDSAGKLYHQVGTTAAQLAVGGGNITVRTR
jgi:hypothetical protein